MLEEMRKQYHRDMEAKDAAYAALLEKYHALRPTQAPRAPTVTTVSHEVPAEERALQVIESQLVEQMAASFQKDHGLPREQAIEEARRIASAFTQLGPVPH